MNKYNVVSLHLDETNMQSGVSCSNKTHLLGNTQNDMEKLGNSIQTFLLNTLLGKN